VTIFQPEIPRARASRSRVFQDSDDSSSSSAYSLHTEEDKAEDPAGRTRASRSKVFALSEDE
jgi:hypothetical protein